MDALYARYPFLSGAREAVAAVDADLAAIVGEDRVVERARGRIGAAIEEGTVGPPHRSDRVELLSYPVARVLVSLVDEPGLLDRYARAEAETAIRRFREDADAEELRSVEREPLTLGALLAEFDLRDAVDRSGERVHVAVPAYLRLAGDLPDREWRLVDRAVADGRVAVTSDELMDLLREAIRDRVADGLPLDVPGGIADSLDPVVASIRERLADLDLDRDIDAVEPDLFPPCVAALLERVDDGESLPPHSRFALTAFLADIGMDPEAIIERYGAEEAEPARYQLDHLRDGSGSAYPSPSCRTMQAYGDCVDMDALCERIAHPLEYYRRRLDGDDDVIRAVGE